MEKEALIWKPNGPQGFVAMSEHHIFNARPAGKRFNVSVALRSTLKGIGYSRHDTIEDAMHVAEMYVVL